MQADPFGEKKPSLSGQAVYKMVKRRQVEAKIKGPSPHDFRKTFVGTSSTPQATPPPSRS